MRKLELEIQQLQKNARRNAIKKKKKKKHMTFLIIFHNIYLFVFTPNRQLHSE